MATGLLSGLVSIISAIKSHHFLLIAVSAPAGVVTAMFAQQYWNEHEFGTSIVCQSTILSIVSIPVIMSISNLIWL